MADAAAFFQGLAGALRVAHDSDWRSIARPNQLPPEGDWRVWLILTGRGWGKTRALCEFVRAEVQHRAAKRIALVGATAADVRDVLIEGPAGLLEISPAYCRPVYEPSKRRLTWPNGAIATAFSADEPDRLRGPQHDLAICDELAAWGRPEALDMLLLGMRLGKNPRLAIATTPRPTKVIRELLAREGKDVIVTRGSTLENRDNLAPAYIEQILQRYKGTRLERQEVLGQVLEDTPGALWTREILDACRVGEAPQLTRVVVAIDPAGSSAEGADETGIIVAGIGENGHGYVLEDVSGRHAPPEWARRAITAYRAHRADRIICETNFGGEMVAATIAAVDSSVPVKTVSSSRGKVLRAEPIAAFFEQRRAHIVGTLPELEDQAASFTTDWQRSRDGSPDRVDAMVFALAELMDGAAGFEAWCAYVTGQAARDRAEQSVPLPPPTLPNRPPRPTPPRPTAGDPTGGLLSIYQKTYAGAGGGAYLGEVCGACGEPIQPGGSYTFTDRPYHERCFRLRNEVLQ